MLALCRLNQVVGGRVRIDGIDCATLPLHSSAAVLCDSRCSLFAGSLVTMLILKAAQDTEITDGFADVQTS